MLTILFYHASLSFSKLLTHKFLIPVVITKFFNPIVELAIPIGIPTKEAKAEMEAHPVFVKIAISECSI